MGVEEQPNVEVECFGSINLIEAGMFESMPLMATRYLYSWPDGQACFFETAGVIYTLGGHPRYYVEGDYVYWFESGKPAFSIRDKHLYPFPAGAKPAYYFGN